MEENRNIMGKNNPDNKMFMEPKKPKNGSPIGIIIIIIILLIGGYFLLKDKTGENIPKNEEAIVDQVEEISTQTIDDELNALESELDLDAELQAIEDDLNNLDDINLDDLGL